MHKLSGLVKLPLTAMILATLAACGGGQDSSPKSDKLLASTSGSGLVAGGESFSASDAVAPVPLLTTAVARTESALSGAEQIHIGLVLKLNDVAALDKFVEEVQDPASPNFRQFLSHDQIMRRFGPTEAQIAATTNFLSAKGFANIKVSRENFMVEADAPAAVASAAFQTTLARYVKTDGVGAHANKTPVMLPKNLQTLVQGVFGLNTVSEFKTHSIKHERSVAREAVGVNAVAGVVGHYPREFPGIYGVGSTPTASGVTVGIIAQGKLDQTLADLVLYEQRNGIPHVATSVVYTGTPSTDVSGLLEWNLDSQSIVGMSGGVGKLVFYAAPTMSTMDIVGAVGASVSANEAKVVSISLGLCEKPSNLLPAFDSYFKVGVAQGQTFAVSSGDAGSVNPECAGNTVLMPASSRYVVAVGGTTLTTNSVGGRTSETAWAGSGGGYSNYSEISPWQATVVAGSKRAVPDIAFNADPSSGALILVNGVEQQVGGTSLSAPLFAATWARMLSQCGNLGNAVQSIYSYRNLHQSMFNDIVSGSNGGYTAATGWDAVTGFGTPHIANIWSTVCPSGAAYYPVAQHIYFAYVGRPADPSGLAGMTSLLRSANAPTDVIRLNAAFKTNPAIASLLSNMQGSAESKAVYPQTTTAAYVSALHQTLFNRPATAAEVNTFTTAVANGTVAIGNLPLYIMSSMLGNPVDRVAAIDMENRVRVAMSFTATLKPATAPYYSGTVAATSARNMLQKVTYSPTEGVDNEFTQASYIAAFQSTINATIAGIVAGIPQ